MKATAFVIVFALSLQLASTANRTTCDNLEDLIESINNPTILGMCHSIERDCTRVLCLNSFFPEIEEASITVLPCAFPRPSLNLQFSGHGDVLGNFTSYRDEKMKFIVVANIVRVFSLDWIIQYNQNDPSLMFQLNETDQTRTTVSVNTTMIPLNTSGCADCEDLQPLVDNIDPTILGVCAVRKPCSEVACVDTTYPGLGDTSITVLPCASPQPSLNILVLAGSGDVLGNFTSYKDEVNQMLIGDIDGGTSVPVFSLNWTIQYNEADESLLFQVNGTDLVFGGPPASVVNATTIPLDRSECAGAPGMRFMISAVLLSLLFALLAN